MSEHQDSHNTNAPVIHKDAVVEQVKVNKDVHVVQPVIHREVVQTHVHPHVEHKYEKVEEPTVTHDTSQHSHHADGTIMDKVKSFFSHGTSHKTEDEH